MIIQNPKINVIETENGVLNLGTNNLHVSGVATFLQGEFTKPTGTAPFSVVSTTVVSNLNADTVDGSHASAFETTLTKGNMTASSPIAVDQTRSVIGGAVVISHVSTAGNIHIPTGGATNQILKNSGASGTGAWGTVTENAGALSNITSMSLSGQITNNLTPGTAPFNVASTTMNPSLNADMVDGVHNSAMLHNNVSSEISAITEKTTIVDADVLLIEDSAESYAKKKSLLSTIADMIIPVGTITAYGGLTAPAGYFLADGTAYSRATYAALYNVITASKGTCTISNATPAIVTLNNHGLITGDIIEFTTDGALPASLAVNTNYYVVYINANTFNIASTLALANAGTKIATSNAGSGTHTLRYCPFGISTATNFNVPDFRNVYLRGANSATRAINAQANITYDALSIGLLKNDRMQGHYHDLYLRNNISTVSSGGNALDALATTILQGTSNAIRNPKVDESGNGTPRTGTTSEPQSIGINYIIKY